VDPSKKTILQVLNCSLFFVMIFCNFASSFFLPIDLATISLAWPLTIDPATYAFAIWGVIYVHIAVFAVYQALPDSCCPDRNNDLIFNKLGYLPSINFCGNSLWLFIFQ